MPWTPPIPLGTRRIGTGPGFSVGAFARRQGGALLMWAAAALAVVMAYIIAGRYFEFWPHLEDEVAYWWQAQAAAQGALTVPSPPEPDLFLIPFVIDRDGRRFGKYPPGWPVVLALGLRLGRAEWVNPLLAGLALLLLAQLGRRVANPTVAVVALGLALTSPFFWLQAGSLLSHMWAWVLTLTLSLALWDLLFRAPSPGLRWVLAGLAGAAWGLLLLTRPWTAVSVALPWLPWTLGALRRRPLLRRPLGLSALLALLAGGLFLTWQMALTGHPWQSPYTLWWPYDRLGFGPGHGPLPQGHSLRQAWINTRFTLRVAAGDLLGWLRASWLLLPLGLLAAWRRPRAWAVLGTFPALVLTHLAYWVGAWVLGPRYYFEGLHSWLLATAWGLVVAWRWLGRYGRRGSIMRAGLAALVLGLVTLNLRYYLPLRLRMMYGLYDMTPRRVALFFSPAARDLPPAWVRVEGVRRWNEYAVFVPLQDPWLTAPWVFVIDPGRDRAALAHLRTAFADRREIVYNPRQQPPTLRLVCGPSSCPEGLREAPAWYNDRDR